MTPSADLFELIRSLDKQEKIYFRTVHAIRPGDTREYVRLFEALSGSRRYDEAALKKKFAGRSFVRRLPAVKHYLWNQVLETLIRFYADKSEESVLRGIMDKAAMLQRKGFSRQALRLLRKGKQLALRAGFFLPAAELIALEKQIARSTAPAGRLSAEIERLSAEEDEVLRRHKRLSEYILLENRFYDRRRLSLFPRNTAERNWYRTMLRHPLLQDEKRADSLEARYYFFRLRGQCRLLTGDLAKSYKDRQRLVELLRSQELFTTDLVMKYSGALYELAITQRDLGLYAQAFSSAQEILAVANQYPRIFRSEKTLSVLFKRNAIIETDLAVFTGDTAAGLSAARRAEAGLKRFGKLIDKDLELIILYNEALIWFMAGHYKAAQQWLNRIINDHKHDYIQDAVAFARIFNLFLQIEKGNEDLVESTARSTLRYLQKRARLYRTEKIILQFIHQWLRTGEGEEKRKLMLHIKKQFDELRDDPLEKPALEFFDFSSWLRSKIEGRNFAEMLREQALRNTEKHKRLTS